MVQVYKIMNDIDKVDKDKLFTMSQYTGGGRTGLAVRASDSGSGDPGSILGRVGVLFP